ncbi:MAG: C10 family peptidase [Bacteroidales bacterium]|nr:C10 family peptidase [Bacteroidales bacterium]
MEIMLISFVFLSGVYKLRRRFMRKFLTFFLIIISCSVLLPRPVSEDHAKLATLSFFQSIDKFAANDGIDIVETNYLTHQNDTVIYLFHIRGGGYIFISGDDAAYPVLGYGFTDIPSWTDAHSTVKGWMGKNLGEIAYIRKQGLKADQKIRRQWNDLLQGRYRQLSTTADPLLMSTWNQNWPYNEFAPADQFGPGGRALAGCVAVSMAQLMYYYRYPDSGTGSHGYYHSQYGYLSADFGNTQYDFNSMVDDLGGKTNSAVATLLYHCGVSVEMYFSANGSGASMYNVKAAMENYFNYADSGSYYAKSSFSDSQWKSMIRNEIDHKRPMMYAGYPQNGAGHAFNIDGYQGTDHFHFNWGWSGSYDGYYYLSALNPGSSDFTYGQAGSFHVVPGSNYPQFCTSANQTLTSMRGTFEDGSGHYNYQNNTSCSWLVEPADQVSHIELSFDKVNLENGNDTIKVYDGSDSSAPIIAVITGDSIPPVISSSDSTLFIVFNTNSTGTASGFHASYEAFSPIYCQSMNVLTAPSGTLSDGSGTYPYNNNSFCKWFIRPASATRIEADITLLDTYDSHDFIAIYDPATSPGTLLGEYYGNTPPSQVISNSGEMLIVFSTDGNNVADGFEISYSSDVVPVEELARDDLKIYPNPSTGKVNIRIPDATIFDSFEIRTLDSRKVAENQLVDGFELDLPAGVYFGILKGPLNSVVKKIIVTKNGR